MTVVRISGEVLKHSGVSDVTNHFKHTDLGDNMLSSMILFLSLRRQSSIVLVQHHDGEWW